MEKPSNDSIVYCEYDYRCIPERGDALIELFNIHPILELDEALEKLNNNTEYFLINIYALETLTTRIEKDPVLKNKLFQTTIVLLSCQAFTEEASTMLQQFPNTYAIHRDHNDKMPAYEELKKILYK